MGLKDRSAGFSSRRFLVRLRHFFPYKSDRSITSLGLSQNTFFSPGIECLYREREELGEHYTMCYFQKDDLWWPNQREHARRLTSASIFAYMTFEARGTWNYRFAVGQHILTVLEPIYYQYNLAKAGLEPKRN